MKVHVDGSETWKNSEFYPLYRLWDLEERSTKQRALAPRRHWDYMAILT